MKKHHRWQRILILSLLSFSVCAPIVLVSRRFKTLTSFGLKEFVEEDSPSVKHMTDVLRLNSIEQESANELKGPELDVFKDKNFSSVVRRSSYEYRDSDQFGNAQDDSKLLEANETNEKGKHDHQIQKTIIQMNSMEKEPLNQEIGIHDQRLRFLPFRVVNEKVKQMRDQLITAKAYLSFAPPGSTSRLMKSLRARIRELEREVGEASRDSDLPRSASQKMRSMEITLTKASQVYPDCSAMATKLLAMAYDAEEQVQVLNKNQESYLVQLAGRTTPKGLHCLSMQLTAEYFLLQPEERHFSNQQNLNDPNLYHYAVFSDNVLACSVVVNSTISSAKEPEKIVFHVVTDSLNLPAISMWFLLNPPGKATIHVQSTDNFDWLYTKYNSTLKEQKSYDPRYSSSLGHLHFYLPDIFPALNKILLFHHDVVVQRDLTEIWSLDMKGKVNAAVETCLESEAALRSMHMYMNFSDSFFTSKFDSNVCTWAFGMNLFDLHEWRRKKLTMLYRNYLQLGLEKQLWTAGSFPIGWTFYNQTVALGKRWHTLGLGYNSGIPQGDIENAVVIHYDGFMKPWLEIGIAKYKGYWSKHVLYDHPYLQQCNIRE